MAAVLESLPIPRASAARTPPSAPPQFAAVSVARKNGGLLESRGLRVDGRFQKLALASAATTRSTAAGAKRRGVVVCDAKEAAVEVVPGVTDAQWKSLVLESELPVLVEFWAPWCGPCRMIHPVIDELSKQFAGKLKCFKVNTDDSPSIATQYGIRSIPTVLIFKDGDKKDAIIGAVPKPTLVASIEKFLL